MREPREIAALISYNKEYGTFEEAMYIIEKAQNEAYNEAITDVCKVLFESGGIESYITRCKIYDLKKA